MAQFFKDRPDLMTFDITQGKSISVEVVEMAFKPFDSVRKSELLTSKELLLSLAPINNEMGIANF